MSNNNIAVSSPTPSYSGSQDYSTPTAAQTDALHKASSATAAALTSTTPTGSASGVIPTSVLGSSTLIFEGTISENNLGGQSLLQTMQADDVLPPANSYSGEELESGCHEIADALEEGKPTTESDSTASTSDTSSTSSTTSASDSTSSTSSTTSSEDTSSTSSSSSTSTTTTDDTTTTSGTVSMTQIMDELGELDVSISNDAEAQNTALIDSINCMTQAAINAGNDTMKAGNELMEGAIATFLTTAAFTTFSLGATAGATSEANETADEEAMQQTNASVTESEKATAATEKAISPTGTDEDLAAAKQANAKAKEVNNSLPDSSAVKQQNQETITANENAIKAKEAENAAAKQKAATTTPQAPADSVADSDGDANQAREGAAAPNPASDAVAKETTADTESAKQLQTAKESLAKSNNLIDSKSSLTASKQATAATERYLKNPSEENKAAALNAHKNAEAANAKLPAGSKLKEQNTETLKANQAAIDNAGKPEGLKNLNEAKASQAEAAKAMPKNVYRRSKFTSSNTAMQTFSIAMQRSTIINQLGEQTSNVVNVSFQTKAKVAEGEGQIEQADSSAFNQAITSTNTSMQSLYTLAGDLRSSSSSVAQDMASMVSSTRA